MFDKLCFNKTKLVEHKTFVVEHITQLVKCKTKFVQHITSLVQHKTKLVEYITELVEHIAKLVLGLKNEILSDKTVYSINNEWLLNKITSPVFLSNSQDILFYFQNFF